LIFLIPKNLNLLERKPLQAKAFETVPRSRFSLIDRADKSLGQLFKDGWCSLKMEALLARPWQSPCGF
jgi:hypothetical protein